MQVALIVVCACFLALWAATGVVSIYIPYEAYWEEDTKFYLLDTLPEFLSLSILAWPTLMARMAQAWPQKLKGKEEKGEGKTERDSSRDDECSAHGTDGDNNKVPPAVTDSAADLILLQHAVVMLSNGNAASNTQVCLFLCQC